MSINPKEIPTGAVRYNTDSNKMEVYIGSTWMEVAVSSPNLNGGTRGMFHGGGSNPGSDVVGYNVIQMINISSQGDSTDFGDLLNPTQYAGACSSRNRSIIFGGQTPSANPQDVIQFTTIASQGNSQDFGNMSEVIASSKSASNNTRAVMGSGYNPSPSFTSKKFLDFITIASTGNANDFGDLITARRHHAGFSSHTRGFVAAGWGSPANLDSIEYVNIATLGNAADFGDTVSSQYGSSGYSNAVRGVIYMGSNPSSGNVNTLCYITMSTLGNAIDFGDVSANHYGTDGVSSPTRGVIGGGDPAIVTIEYFQIMTTGDAADFGDLNTGTKHAACCSNGHGGL